MTYTKCSQVVHAVAPVARFSRVLLLWFLFCGPSIGLFASQGMGVLKGTVTDPTGQVIPGVTVTVTAVEPSEIYSRPPRRETMTDFEGKYQVSLPAGEYEIHFQLVGFSSVVSRFTIQPDGREVVNVGMSLASIEDAIIVTARAPVISISSTEMGSSRSASSKRSKRIPNGWYRSDFDTESYDPYERNRFRDPHDFPLSTFATDVDTASFSNIRRFLNEGQRPPRDAVRLEELLNYFTEAYGYPQPNGKHPFSLSVDVAPAPWHPERRLVRIGLQGKHVERSERPDVNLIFLLDVSGSMNANNKLPWVIESLRLLVDQLGPRDRVGIVVYAGAAGVVLESTPVSEKQRILEALGRLKAGGSTNGGEGIQLAYSLAREGIGEGAINRVVLATDGDWNVGITDRGDLVRKVQEEAEKSVFLTVLGFGMENYKDDLLEDLSKAGDGSYAYIDSLSEARKVLVEQVQGTLVTIAKEVKIQAEFNPDQVESYRLLGYENRLMADEDFDDDDKDGGEIGAGHTVTALYEVIPSTLASPVASRGRNLRYQRPAKLRRAARGDELMTVKLRYQLPDGGRSRSIETIVSSGQESEMTNSLRLAAGLAATAMLLQESPDRGDVSWNVVESLFAGFEEYPNMQRAQSLLDLIALAREVVPEESPVHSSEGR